MYDRKEGTPPPAKPAPKPEEKSPEKPVEAPKTEAKAPEPKPEEKPKEPEAKAPEKAAEPEHKNIKELRTAYESNKKLTAQHEAKIKELEAKLADGGKVQPVADEKVWQDRVSAKDKELNEVRSKLAEHDFTQSSDYQEKYYKPYEASWKRGMQSVMTLKANNEDGTQRDVTQQDAEFLLSLPEGKALTVARQMFGDDIAALTMISTHRQRIQEMHENVTAARANFQKATEERRQKQFVDNQALEEARGKLWVKENKAIAESSPWFKTDENDPEASEILTKGYETIDQMFTAEFNQGKMEDIVRAHATMRHKAAAFDRMEHTVKKLQAELDAVKKERDELMDSAPKGGETTPKPVDADSDKRPSELLDSIKWGGR